MIYIFGHQSPDCDTACSPKVYEWYLKEKGQEAKALVWSKLNNEAKWVFQKFQVTKPEISDKVPAESQVVILDTTDPSQLPENLEEWEILAIYDHHKLGGLKTSSPLTAIIDIVGCTATLVWEKIKKEGLDLPKDMAGLLVSAILSDTLNLTSPTSTDRDKKAVEELEKIAQIDRESHVKEQFAAKSSLEGMSIEEVVNSDAKVFEMGDKRVKIGVFETVDTTKPLAKTEEIKKFMQDEKQKEGYDYFFYFAVDIMKKFSVPIIISDQEKSVLEKAYNQKVDEGIKLEGIVSRKKQMVPQITEAVSS